MRFASSTSLLRKSQNFTLLLTGSTVSVLGNRIALLAFPLLVLAETGSAVWAGWVGFANLIPSLLLSVPAGPLVARWNPRRTMLACESGRGLAIVVVVASVLWSQSSEIFVLLVASFVEGSLGVLYTLAEVRLLRIIVSPEQTPAALAGIEGRTSLAALLGRPLGGLLFDIGRLMPFAIDVLSFLVSVLTLLGIRVDKSSATHREENADHNDGLWGGVINIVRDPYLRWAALASGCSTAVFQAAYLIFITDATFSGASSFTIGLAFACTGLGGILGSMGAKRLFDRHGFRVALCSQWICAAVLPFLILSIDVWMFAIVSSIITFAGVAANVAVNTYMFYRVPDRLVSQVVGVDKMLGSVGAALGPLAGGLLYSSLGTTISLACLAAVSVLLATLMTSVRAIRIPPAAEPVT
ncbi:MFS transporter [Nonomuraea sp. NPDC050691]|uniref:MFS transporter n=1 Tax=Nonomuraea sp. NPDC050691 TaxID=3155661 RepID=UPI0033F0676C